MTAPAAPTAPAIAQRTAPTKPARTALWVGVLLVGVGLALLAQFVTDGVADQNETWHWAQHAALFWGGLMAGAAVIRLYQLGARVA